MYLAGYGIPRSVPTALSLLEQASALGHSEAQSHLGSMYRKGVGVPRNFDKAAVLLRNAAEGGNARAVLGYATMLVEGAGVAKDYREALRVLERMQPRMDAEAQCIAAMLLSHRHPFAPPPVALPMRSSSLLFSSIPYDAERAHSLLLQSSSSDHVRASIALADAYAGQAEPDMRMAVLLYSQAANLTSTYAHARLGFLQYHGVGMEASPSQALVSFGVGAEAGRPEALLMMAAVAWERGGREEGGRLGKVGLRVKEVMDEYAQRCLDALERAPDEWSEQERALLRGLKDEPQRVEQWLRGYEEEKGKPWLGDLHDLLAVLAVRERRNVLA